MGYLVQVKHELSTSAANKARKECERCESGSFIRRRAVMCSLVLTVCFRRRRSAVGVYNVIA